MRNGLPALGEGEPSRQIRMFIHLYAKRKVCNQIFTGYKLIIRDCMDTWEKKGNWQGTVTKYNENIINRAGEWLKENNYPKEISYKQSNGECKTYYVVYA